MSVTATSATTTVTAIPRTLPGVLYFQGDEDARRILTGMNRYRRSAFEQLEQNLREGDWVLLCSSERLVAENYHRVRLPNVRVLAISEMRFRDARTDGAVYSYVHPATPPEMVERAIENALDHINLLATRSDVSGKLANATNEINELNIIGAALSAEHDTERLLEIILTKSREITRSDAGSLYLVETAPAPLFPTPEEEAAALTSSAVLDLSAPGTIGVADSGGAEAKRLLRFKLTQNHSLSLPFREMTMELSPRSIAGYVALSGEPVRIDDAYRLPERVPFTFNRKFDEDSGYRTKSILAVPMKNQKGEVLGVVQLINAKREAAAKLDSLSSVVAQVVPFTSRQQDLAGSLANPGDVGRFCAGLGHRD